MNDLKMFYNEIIKNEELIPYANNFLDSIQKEFKDLSFGELMEKFKKYIQVEEEKGNSGIQTSKQLVKSNGKGVQYNTDSWDDFEKEVRGFITFKELVGVFILSTTVLSAGAIFMFLVF